MQYNFDVLANRKGTNSVKYDEFDFSLPMWVADMDFMVAPKIKEAIQKQLDIGAIGYSLIPDEYYKCFINYYNSHFGTKYKIEEMVYCSGVVASIDSIFKRMAKEGDNVVILTPIYHTFYSCIRNSKLNPLECELKLIDGEYFIDFADLENKLKEEKSSILLLCNPHNPVGKIFSVEELNKIAVLADKYHVFVVSDEIHGLIASPNKKYIPYSLVAKNDYYVTCLASSKAFNLAGLQSACIQIPNEKIRKELQDGFYHDDIGEPNYFAIPANIAAYNESDDWLVEMNEYVYQNKLFFSEYIKKNIPSLDVIWGDATYMMWVDIRKVSNNSREFTKKLSEQTGLLVCPGAQFGKGGEGFFRINLATSRKNVELALHKLEEFVGK